MKRLKQILTIATLVATTQMVMGQAFEVPKNYKFKVQEDYWKYQKDVLNCITWLEDTPIKKDDPKRKKANTFFLDWIAGSPDVTIVLNANVMNIDIKKNPDLLVIFMGGWTKFVLENTEYLEVPAKGNLAGIKSVIKVYNLNKGKGIKKDKNVEKLIELDSKNELEAWIEEQLKK